MLPNMFKIGGDLTPAVVHVAAREDIMIRWKMYEALAHKRPKASGRGVWYERS
jgi:hypothetical protein